MNTEEYRKKLSELTDDQFKSFIEDFGGRDKTIEECVRRFVDNPQHERRICQLLGLITEAEKNTGATIKSAEAASSSSRTAKIALGISIGALLL